MAEAQAAPCICFEYGAVYGCTVGGFVLAMAWDWWTEKQEKKNSPTGKQKKRKSLNSIIKTLKSPLN